jgi:hypothetical protein
MKLYFNPTSTFIVRSSMVSSVPKGKGCNFTKLGCSVLRTSPPCNTRRVPVCCGSSRGAGSSRRRPRPRCGNGSTGGFSLDAVVRIEATDRKGLERLLRYCARPIFASERLLWAQPAARRGQGRALHAVPRMQRLI